MAAAGAFQPALGAVANDAMACRDAGAEAEEKMSLPSGLLVAIGETESGRRDPISGQLTAWPWTINANGVGRLFDTMDEALTTARALLEHGVTSIDVGCFQINLLHHPMAFARLEEAFDPRANAAYAARFLRELRARTGSWESAVAAYHSTTPQLGGPYRDHVLAMLNHTNMAADGVAPQVERILIWTPASVMGRVRIWTPSASGLAPTVISIRPSSGRPDADLPTVKVGMITP